MRVAGAGWREKRVASNEQLFREGAWLLAWGGAGRAAKDSL